MGSRSGTQLAELGRVASTGLVLRAPGLTRRKEYWIGVPALILVALCLRYSALYEHNVVDDAMTSMQYAKQLALGHGLVFNVGQRVEGYTNFAWVLFMTPLYWLSDRLGFDLVTAVTLCNVLLAAANLVLVQALARRWLGESHPAVWLAVGLCLVDNSFAVWAVLGLEVHFLAFFMLLALWFYGSPSPRRALGLGLSLLAAHLTRPDAGLFCAVLLGSQALDAGLNLRRGARSGAKAQALGVLTATSIWLVGYGAYFFWRCRYYGLLLPNTYYLKLGGPIDAWARGLAYARGFLSERAFVPLSALLAALALRRSVVRALLTYDLLHALYVVYVGGDFFAGHRFFVPQIPQLALLSALGAAELWRRGRADADWTWPGRWGITLDGVRGALFAGVLGLLGILFQRGLVRGPLQGEVLAWGKDLTRQTRLFRWLHDHAAPGASIATCLIGHTGFYSGLRVIDMCGVIDPATARRHVKDFGHGKAGHEKQASPEAVLAKRPTFIADYLIKQDLWRRGYFLRADVPEDTYEGIWQLDPTLTRGVLVPGTRVSFDSGKPAGWSASGSAFEAWPSRSNWSGQGRLIGASGGFINTFHPSLGTAATGELQSTPFDLLGDELLFRLAGGNDPDKLRVELVVGGSVVASTTGRQGDQLSRRAWNISGLRGQRAVLRVVDASTGPWGYLALDEIVQWRR